MKESRLVKLLKTFKKDELNSFTKFIESPFLKPSRDVTGLFKYLKENLTDDKSDNLEKTMVYKKIFAGEKYNEVKLVNHMFDLTKTAEDFLAYNTLKEDDMEFQISLSKSYLDKHLPVDSMRVIRILTKNLVPGFSVKKDYISKFRRMTYLKNAYYTQVNDFENLLKNKTDYFNASVVQFVMDFIEILGSREPAKNNYDKELDNHLIKAISECFNIDKFFEIIKSENLQKPYISLFYYILKLLKEPEDAHYYKLKELFYRNLSKRKSPFDREEKYTIFNYLLNYCTQRHTLDFMKESFDVYKMMLKHEAYSESENEFMQTNTYRNIVKICISLKDTKWLTGFIKNYTDKLSPEHRNEMENLAYAHIFFSGKDFDKSLDKINEINLGFDLSKTDIRTLQLKLFYELNYTESAYDLVIAYRTFLSRTANVSKEYKKVFKNFINQYLKLLKIKSGTLKEDPDFIKCEIEKEKYIINKQWLLEKAGELS